MHLYTKPPDHLQKWAVSYISACTWMRGNRVFTAYQNSKNIENCKLHSSVDIIRIWLKFAKIWLTIWPILPENLTKIWPFLTIFDRKSDQLTWKNFNYFLTITRTNNTLIVCTEQKNLTLNLRREVPNF